MKNTGTTNENLKWHNNFGKQCDKFLNHMFLMGYLPYGPEIILLAIYQRNKNHMSTQRLEIHRALLIIVKN